MTKLARKYVFKRRKAEKNYVQTWLVAWHQQQVPCQTPDSRSVSLMGDLFQVMPLLCPRAQPFPKVEGHVPPCLMVPAPLSV